MTNFVQLHYLTVYPPSNPNRDDIGRPKTAYYGGAPRLRLSSQSLKRAARLSPCMADALSGSMGERTRRLGDDVLSYLRDELGENDESARKIAKRIASVFGKLEPEKGGKKKKNGGKEESSDHVHIRQLAFISPDERQAAMDMAKRLIKGDTQNEDLKIRSKEILRTADGAVDLAMFGRMLADAPEFNREAAVQVAHAITTHKAEAEDDYYTAVDDLKKPAEDMGAGFVGEAGFGSGVYYLYICIDIARLIDNLSGDKNLAQKSLEALVEAFATASPSGKRNSYSHHTRASFIRAEAGHQQPRSLASAFLNPVLSKDLLTASIEKLRDTARKIDHAYGASFDASIEMDVLGGTGTLPEIKTFVAGQIADA